MISAGISDSASRQENETARGEIIWGEVVSGNFFDVLGVNAALGRTFLPEEDRTPGTHPVVVIGNPLWQRRFNSDPSIGIRMAIGAQINDKLKLVISEGMILVMMGTVIGLIGAFTVTGLLSSLSFGISPTNLPTFAVAALILVGVSLVACYIPARRATKVDPMIALRYE